MVCGQLLVLGLVPRCCMDNGYFFYIGFVDVSLASNNEILS